MSNPWEADDCAHLRAQYAVYSIPEAAARWCGVPENLLGQVVREASQLSSTGFGRGVWKHPRVPCMEVRSRVIAQAIVAGELPHGREDGETLPEGDMAAAERRAVLGRDLREWMIKAHPNDKPAFLFDEIERSSHTAISADAYRALVAEKNKLAKRLENAVEQYKQLREAKETLEHERNALAKQVEAMAAPGERAETTYQNIIAALLGALFGRLPKTEAHPSFPSEAKLIEAIDQHYSGYPGLSQSNLSRKFPEAKRNLQAQ